MPLPLPLPTIQIYTVLVIREGTVETDRAALMALYNSTGGANWTNNTNWGTDEPLDDWYRVSTNSDGRVRALDLTTYYCEGNNLVGTLPAALGNLDQMEQLYLCGNQLRGTIPDLSNLTYLEHLYLHNNQSRGQLLGAIPASLGDLTSLTVLSLGGNQLTGAIPEELGGLTSLTNLSLWGNQLTGEIPSWAISPACS